MYTPEINFLKERPTGQVTEGGFALESTPVSRGIMGGVGAIAVGAVIAAGALGAYAWALFSFQNELATQKATQEQVVTQLNQAKGQLGKLTALKTELDTIQARTKAFKTFFSNIQPWSGILQDLRGRVPADVWVVDMKSAGNAVTITGGALSFEQVNDFQLTLLQSPFVESVALTDSAKVEGTPTTTPSVTYGLSVALKPLELPNTEVLDTLETKGSTGLVEKIKILRNLETN